MSAVRPDRSGQNKRFYNAFTTEILTNQSLIYQVAELNIGFPNCRRSVAVFTPHALRMMSSILSTKRLSSPIPLNVLLYDWYDVRVWFGISVRSFLGRTRHSLITRYFMWRILPWDPVDRASETKLFEASSHLGAFWLVFTKSSDLRNWKHSLWTTTGYLKVAGCQTMAVSLLSWFQHPSSMRWLKQSRLLFLFCMSACFRRPSYKSNI